MSVGVLFLHNMRTGPCPGWFYDSQFSQFTDAEKSAINTVFAKHVEYEQDASFNEWQISKHVFGGADPEYWVKRFTWDMGLWYCKSVEDIDAKLADYYKK